jgi:hypothetical protein
MKYIKSINEWYIGSDGIDVGLVGYRKESKPGILKTLFDDIFGGSEDVLGDFSRNVRHDVSSNISNWLFQHKYSIIAGTMIFLISIGAIGFLFLNKINKTDKILKIKKTIFTKDEELYLSKVLSNDKKLTYLLSEIKKTKKDFELNYLSRRIDKRIKELIDNEELYVKYITSRNEFNLI